jgi:hypothetical protein
MLNTESPKRTYRQFFSSLGFDENPFAHTNADEEERLQDYFIPPPYFPSVFGDPEHPKSFVVFAPRGGGKSAQRRMIEEQAADSQVLAITYDRFEFPDLKSAADITLAHHLRSVIRCILMGLLVTLHAEPALNENLNAYDKSTLVKLASEYLRGVTEQQLQQALDSLKSIKDKVRDFWNEWLPVLGVGIETLAKTLLKVDIQATEFSATEASAKSTQQKYQISLLVSIAKKLGFKSIYVLIDRVDESDLTGNDQHASFKLVAPLLRDLELLELKGIAFKFFLWDHLEPGYAEIARTDRIAQETLDWDDEMLKQMWRKRLRAFSNGRVQGLNEIATAIPPFHVDDLALIFSNHSPRDMIRIGDQIMAEQQEINRDAGVLRSEAIYDGIDKFCVRRASELVSETTLHDLRKITQVDFTIPYLANDVFREKQARVRNRIMRWRNDGAIVDVDRIDNPGPAENRPVKLMAIADIRVAKTLFPDLSIREFLMGKFRRCPKCGSTVLRDWGNSDTSTRCDSCQFDLARTDTDNWDDWKRKELASQTRRRRRREASHQLQMPLFDTAPDESSGDDDIE